jgi:4-hydroxybenzoyl-CoA thioesterase
MGSYESTHIVRFGQVDYAGIMFYPRFFDNFHAVMEDMFGDRLGTPYMSILKDRRIGFPTVRIETDFRKPFRFGEPMRLVLDATKIGTSSTTLRYRGYNGDDTEVSVETLGTVVCIDLDSFATMPFPPDIRSVLEDLSA